MTITSSPVLGRMLRPLADRLRSEVLDAFSTLKPSEAEEERYHDLAEKNADGTITAEERKELESIVSANTLLSLLRKEAREVLNHR
ncbi:MAG TPA: hypothetical protein DDZ88_28190 [Verrucomicrobiales bacterium]|nr:hypothetical protein [Verrucomicrobiales bacterium]